MLYCSYVKIHKGALKMKFQYLLIGTSLSFIPQTINAQCVATQDCATLGYTETSCSGGTGVKCPFGNKWACFKSESEICNDLGFTLSCTGTNQNGGASQTCNGKYNICKCVANFTWNTDTKSCEANTSNCIIGALYYSDGTCSDKLESSKTLLGVVIYEKSGNENGWIMAIKPIATDIEWNTGNAYSTGITDKVVSASCTNTKKLVALGSNFKAANKANSYKPTGTPSGKSWCLPSYDLLNNINNSTKFTKINLGITTAKGTKLGAGSVINYEAVCSSTEYDSSSVWDLDVDISGRLNMENRDKIYGNFSVRPVLPF